MLSKSVVTTLPTKWGVFNITVWRDHNGLEPIAISTPNLNVAEEVLVRVHSECETGDTFYSLSCDCGMQKEKSLEMINKSKNGVFIYLRQEGRGIGLFEKIKSYQLQAKGYDTHEANILLGYTPDSREYSIASKILKELKVHKIKIITNNPSKISELSEFGFEITQQIPLTVKSNKYNKKYLDTKKIKFKHLAAFNKNNYYIGISDVKTSEQLREIAAFVKDRIKDPFLRISIGIKTDSSSLTDAAKKKAIERLVKETEKYMPLLNPVLYFSFENSKEYIKDMEQVVKNFPFVKRIQLNELERDYKRILHIASKNFDVIFPIGDKSLYLLDDASFVKMVRSKKVSILLDNSRGKGKKEQSDVYKERILMCLDKKINNIGLAGGFGPDGLQAYFQIKSYFKINFSIDAQTNLETNGKLDMKKVKLYLDQFINPYNQNT